MSSVGWYDDAVGRTGDSYFLVYTHDLVKSSDCALPILATFPPTTQKKHVFK